MEGVKEKNKKKKSSAFKIGQMTLVHAWIAINLYHKKHLPQIVLF